MRRVVSVSIIVVALCGTPHSTDAAVAVRAIGTLSASERLHLPDSTPISVFGGRVTTLGTLRAVHVAREASLSNAVALGRRAALLISSQHFRLQANGTTVGLASSASSALHPMTTKTNELRSLDLSPGLYAGVIFRGQVPVVTPPPTKFPIARVGVAPGWWQHVIFGPSIIPMSQSALTRYARDYQNFCTAAQATACVYLPAGVSAIDWETGGYQDPNTNYVYDYLIVDPGVCQAEGGAMSQGACRYAYPALSLTNYVPAAANPYAVNCPGGTYSGSGGDWLVAIDPHGAAQAQFVPIGSYDVWPGSSGSSPLETCVVQVYSD
jgi:hypothetical protein